MANSMEGPQSYSPEQIKEIEKSREASDKGLRLKVLQSGGKGLELNEEQIEEIKKLKDKEDFMKYVKSFPWGGQAIKVAPQELRADKEFVLEVVKKYGYNLFAASLELQADKEVVMEAVRENGVLSITTHIKGLISKDIYSARPG